jgi:ABC-type polysaccharide/polyol phosphate export permease
MNRYLADVWQLRFFWFSLVCSDLRSRYRRSLIGVGWSLLHPIAMTTVLCTIFSQVFQVDPRSYAPFLAAGLVTWNFITAVLTQGCHCFLQGEPYIRQHPAPLAIYPLRIVLGSAIHLLLGLSVVIALVWFLHGFGNIPALLSLAPTLILFIITAWSLAICMGVLNVVFQDTQHITEIVLQILFYVTPVMYSADRLHARCPAWLINLNPLGAYLDLIRVPILNGRFPPAGSLAIAMVITTLAAAAAALTLRRFEGRIILYL